VCGKSGKNDTKKTLSMLSSNEKIEGKMLPAVGSWRCGERGQTYY
jgi:hypothetical protein